jgi:uncharacterized protein YfbU (UPF0304 family)
MRLKQREANGARRRKKTASVDAWQYKLGKVTKSYSSTWSSLSWASLAGTFIDSSFGVMRLTKTERLLLANQYEILARLNPDFESSYYTKREVVLRGFELDMNSLFHTFDEEGLSVDGCSEVINILAMYEHLDGSFQRLEDKNGISPGDIQFPGFHEDTEGRQFSYTNHLMKDHRFMYLHRDYQRPAEPMLPAYRTMLRVWEPMKSRLAGVQPWLSAAEILQVLQSGKTH